MGDQDLCSNSADVKYLYFATLSKVFFGVTRRISSLKQLQDHKFDREKRSCTDENFEVTVSSLRFICISSKYIYWTLYDTLIILNVIDIYKLLRLSIHNQTNMYAACV